MGDGAPAQAALGVVEHVAALEHRHRNLQPGLLAQFAQAGGQPRRAAVCAPPRPRGLSAQRPQDQALAGASRHNFFSLLKGTGVNAIRLRVWVNPQGGWNDGADTLNMAKRAKAQGMRILIDFHYSDSWADPGKQTKPAAWSNHDFATLVKDVYSHTSGILSYLKSNGIDVSWVQVGNEINSGMLWPDGKTPNFGNLAQLINSGYNASKSVYPNAKVMATASLKLFFFTEHLAAGGRRGAASAATAGEPSQAIPNSVTRPAPAS
ncbi:arabinogalactan endo-1,4-beta-galactosidase [Pantoea ananatis]|uniref:arabinogalactan endo-1,4-beta-galactosidase n=1 Tax=Pantoea ananas TaxID=553 RepID=UPI00221F960C|nr:arabinogalactan endo-1,4-beta-galactosidase [Pantoea ananatis]